MGISPGVLSVFNYGGNGGIQGINGIGGAIGELGGVSNPSLKKSFRGRVAAVLAFNELLSIGELEDIEKHKKLSEKTLELEAWNTLHGGSKDSSPVKLASDSVKEKLEKLDESVNKPAGNKGLPKHKTS